MNISKHTIKALQEFYCITFLDDNINETTPENATSLSIGFTVEGDYIGKTIKATKKEIDFDYIINKINTDSVYKNFSKKFGKLISQYGLSAYATTYGIGIFVGFGFDSKEKRKLIENTLNDLNIQYSTEYSDAQYVFRYKFSKSKENIENIDKFLNQ